MRSRNVVLYFALGWANFCIARQRYRLRGLDRIDNCNSQDIPSANPEVQTYLDLLENRIDFPGTSWGKFCFSTRYRYMSLIWGFDCAKELTGV
ncbi:hypothetical protein F4677DRAFT_432426 [Hypoxylon crocopeplum]|nr:hypothetical protein F4677DRAFT_432426 [Hypoxylon crocopeplum]